MSVTNVVQIQSKSASPFAILERRVISSIAVIVLPLITPVSPFEAPGHSMVTPLESILKGVSTSNDKDSLPAYAFPVKSFPETVKERVVEVVTETVQL